MKANLGFRRLLVLKFFGLLFALFFLSIATLHAAAPFAMVKGEDDVISIYAPGATAVAAKIEPGTVGKTVDLPPYSFQISYGRDTDDRLSLVITQNPDNPTPLSFTYAGHLITMNGSDVATLTTSNDGKNLLVRSDNPRGVAIDGQPMGTGLAVLPNAAIPTNQRPQYDPNNQVPGANGLTDFAEPGLAPPGGGGPTVPTTPPATTPI